MDRYSIYNCGNFSNSKKIKSFCLEHKIVSRIQISNSLSISKSDVTKVINDLIEKGVVNEIGDDFNNGLNKNRGRRKQLININKDYKLLIGVYIDSKDISIAITNMTGETLQKTAFFIKEKGYIEILENVVLNIDELLSDNYITRDNVFGAGVVVDKHFLEEFSINGELLEISKLKKDLSYGTKVNICTSTVQESKKLAHTYFNTDIDSYNLFLLGCANSLETFFVLGL